MSRLIVAQCGGQKIWQENPGMGPVRAKDAYTSDYFKKQRAYAEKFGDSWVILSARYGFLDPETKISDYNVTFKKKASKPISVEELAFQVKRQNLDSFGEIVVLGGKEYLEATVLAFEGTGVKIIAPFKGMKIGIRLRAIKEALGR